MTATLLPNGKQGETVDIEEGYTVPRGGIMARGSYLDEAGLTGKLVPIPAKAEVKAR